MALLDSNILIYLRHPEFGKEISAKLVNQRLSTCNIIIAEVLGFKGLEPEDAKYFEQLFAAMKNCSFNSSVTKKTIEIRRAINIQLPDAIIAATAIENDLALWTHNAEDFKDVPGINLVDPLE